jgi:hypothetical protein
LTAGDQEKKPSTDAVNLYEAIKSNEVATVKSLLSSNDASKISPNIRITLVNKAILSGTDSREILDALFANQAFKNVVAEVAFRDFVKTLFAFSPIASSLPPMVNKLSALLDHFGGTVKFSPDKDYTVQGIKFKLNSDFVTAALTFAIKAGVSTQTISKVLNNPHFDNLKMFKGHFYELADTIINESHQIDSTGQVSKVADRAGQDNLLNILAEKYKTLFHGEDPDFWNTADNFKVYTVDTTVSPVHGEFNATANLDTTQHIPDSKQPEVTGTTKDSDQQKPDASIPENGNLLDLAYYANAFRSLDIDIGEQAYDMLRNIKNRYYTPHTIRLHEDSLDRSITDAVLVGASLLREKDIMKKNTSQQFVVKDGSLNKIEQKCAIGQVTFKGHLIDARVDIALNSAPVLNWTFYKSAPSNVDNCQEATTSPDNVFSNAVNNYYEFAWQYSLRLDLDQLDVKFNSYEQ